MTTQSTGPLPGHAGDGRPCARTPAKPCATSPLSAAPSSPQHDLSGEAAAAVPDLSPPPPAPPAGADERITAPNGNDLRRRRRVGRPRTLTRGDQQHAARGIGGPPRPRSGTSRPDGSVTLTMPINERTAGDTRANAITNVDITVDPAPATTDLREIRAATKQALIRSQGGARRTVDTDCPSFLWCLSGSASDGSARPPTVRPAWAHPTSVRSTRPSTGQTAQTPTTSP